MKKTSEDRGNFKGRIKTRSGHLVTVSIYRKKDGKWKIFSVGSAKGITSFLPFSVFQLVKLSSFETLEDAKWAVKSA